MPEYIPPSRDLRKCKYSWFDTWDRLVNLAVRLTGSPQVAVGPGEIAIDTHIHTMFSHCSISMPETIIRQAVKLGLGGVAAMDHNDVSAYRELCRCADDMKRQRLIPEEFLIIPGIEVSSLAGHIGAFFFSERLPDNRSVEDTVRIIHEGGGLAVAVHPYCLSGIGSAVFDAPFDAVELESATIFASGLAEANRAICSDARLDRAAKLGSSDAHYINSIGACYTAMKMSEPTLEGFRTAILERKTSPRVSPACIRLRRALGVIPRFNKIPKHNRSQNAVAEKWQL